MQGKGSKANKFFAILALLSVVSMIVFWFFMQSYQSEQIEQMQEQGEQLLVESEVEKEIQEAELSIQISCVEGESVFLANGSGVEIDIAGYELYLNGQKQHTFPEGTVIEPQGSLELNLRGKWNDSHNDVLALYTNEFELVDQRLYKTLVQQEELPILSVPSGFYDVGFQVEITVPENTTVYITTDGTVPTIESTVYQQPIDIENRASKDAIYAVSKGISKNTIQTLDLDQCTVLQAIAVDENGNCSEVVRGIYFVGLDTKLMYADMPIISIVTNPDNLFDYYTGIYVSGRAYEDALASGADARYTGNYYMGWSTEASLQYFEPNRNMTYDSDVLLKVVPDEYAANEQKNIQITSNGIGAGKGSTLSEHFSDADSSIILDNGQADLVLKIREVLLESLLENEDSLVMGSTPCVLFLNGEYWGVYLMKESLEQNILANKYDLNPNDIALIQNWKLEEISEQDQFAELYNYIIQNDMQIEENYSKVLQELDIDSYLDYICTNIYIANSMWNGYTAWKSNVITEDAMCDGRWHFVMDEFDTSMAIDEYSTYSIDTYLFEGVAQDYMLQSLMRNDAFRMEFVNKMNRLMNETLNAETVEVNLDKLMELYRKPTVASGERFRINLTEAGYESRIVEIKEFFENRQEYIMTYTTEFLEMERNFPVILQEPDGIN